MFACSKKHWQKTLEMPEYVVVKKWLNLHKDDLCSLRSVIFKVARGKYFWLHLSVIYRFQKCLITNSSWSVQHFTSFSCWVWFYKEKQIWKLFSLGLSSVVLVWFVLNWDVRCCHLTWRECFPEHACFGCTRRVFPASFGPVPPSGNNLVHNSIAVLQSVCGHACVRVHACGALDLLVFVKVLLNNGKAPRYLDIDLDVVLPVFFWPLDVHKVFVSHVCFQHASRYPWIDILLLHAFGPRLIH